MPHRPRMRFLAAPEEWNRRRLQIVLALGACLVAALVTGGMWALLSSGGAVTNAHGRSESTGHVRSPEDQLAARSLPAAGGEAAQPGALVAASAATIAVPPPTGVGAAQVRIGFPHSPEGALAQLIAIDQRALESASVVSAQDVIRGWAEAGGPTVRSWSGVAAVLNLLSAAGLPGDGTGDLGSADGVSDLQVELRPAMGLIKGSVGEDFVVPCVDFVATITPAAAAEVGSSAVRVAVADCQRMVWRGDRWRIGPGPEPAAAPSIWPGTQDSYDAGYQWLSVTP